LQHEALVAELRKQKERADTMEAKLHAENQNRYMQEMATLYTDIDILIYLLRGECTSLYVFITFPLFFIFITDLNQKQLQKKRKLQEEKGSAAGKKTKKKHMLKEYTLSFAARSTCC
jgi:hypothetical protein